MIDMLERAGIAADDEMASQVEKGITLNRPADFAAVGRAALLAALDPSDEALLNDIGEAYRLGMGHVLNNLPEEGPIGAINEAMKLSGARFVLNLLRARCGQGEQS